MKKQLLLLTLLLLTIPAHSQALIALVFGKEITNDRLEMGLFMAAQGSYLTNSGSSNPTVHFAIGAYTDIKLGHTEHWVLANYMVFKSPLGGSKLPFEYSLIPNIEESLQGVTINRWLTYFDITPLLRYNFNSSFAIGIGPQVGIRLLAKDTYHTTTDSGGDLSYAYNIKSSISLINAGLAVDFQYRMMKGKGLRLNVRYEQGFTNVYKSETGFHSLNMMFHIGVGIPIRSAGSQAKNGEKQ